MKKIMVLFAVFGLLLCACAPQDANLNASPSEASRPTQSAQKGLAVTDWQLEAPQYPSYEEYFSTTREFSQLNLAMWTKGDRKFRFVKHKDAADPRKITFLVECVQTGETYLVPGTEAYAEYSIANADGRYAYLHNSSQFVRINMASGKVEVLLDNQNFCTVCLKDNLVLYYTSYVDGGWVIGRFYLPTQKYEILHTMRGEYYCLDLYHPSTNTEPITWAFINPQLAAYMKKELENLNSKYKICEEVDFSEFWEKKDGMTGLLHYAPVLRTAQSDSGIPAYVRYMYDPITGILSCQTGIIDNCPESGDMRHAHYNGEITLVTEPAIG